MVRSRLLWGLSALTIALALSPADGLTQTRAQLIEGAKKEGQLILSWGTGTMGGIEGAATLEKAFNKTYGLNLPIQIHPRSGDAAVCQPNYSRSESRAAVVIGFICRVGESCRAHVA